MAIETGFGSTVGGVSHEDPPRVLREVELNDDKRLLISWRSMLPMGN